MTFIATLIALVIERFFHWSHLRHWQWFSRYQHFLGTRFAGWPAYVLLAACVIPPVLLVGLVSHFISDGWYHIPTIIFDVIILVYCMGPSNLWVQIYNCIRTLNKEDTHSAIEEVKKAFGIDTVNQPQAFHKAFTRAIFVAANQRIFVVIFWFTLLGPLGAVLYRSVCLCVGNVSLGITDVALFVQRLLDWLPARLFALVLALAGNFTKVFSHLKLRVADGINSSDMLLSECGIASLDAGKAELMPEDGTAENEALTLLDRVFVIGLVVLAIMVLVI